MSSSSRSSPPSWITATSQSTARTSSSPPSTTAGTTSPSIHPSLCTNVHCPCRTVSSVSPRTPTIARVQLNPYIHSTTLDLSLISPTSSFTSELDLFSSNYSQASSNADDTQDHPAHDFTFDDLFDWDHGTAGNDAVGPAAAAVTSSKPVPPPTTAAGTNASDFSYSHYAHNTATAAAAASSKKAAAAGGAAAAAGGGGGARIFYTRSGLFRPAVHLRPKSGGGGGGRRPA